MKRILLIGYSQTGQLYQILDNILAPLQEMTLDQVKIEPKEAYSFPWDSHDFFDKMPETVLERPIELQDIEFKYSKYDLIIIGYQPWFLSPSPPPAKPGKSDDVNISLEAESILFGRWFDVSLLPDIRSQS